MSSVTVHRRGSYPGRLRGAWLLVVAGWGPLVAACSLLDPTFSEPALIILGRDTAEIAAPEAVGRGLAFEVSVGTFGGGCTRIIGRTETKVSGMLAEIRPYNETWRDRVCPSNIVILRHTTSLRFDEAGVATIRIVGDQEALEGGYLGPRRPAQLERQVLVQ